MNTDRADIIDGTQDTYEQTAVAVEQWYDRSIRSWVTILVDADRAQIGDANFDGTRADAKVSKAQLERQIGQSF